MGITPQYISAKENSSVKFYRKLSESKKTRTQEKCFVLEGYRLVSDALKNGAEITMLFITENAYERFGEELCSLSGEVTRVLCITDELGKYMAETENTQGVFAVCRMPVQKSWNDFLKKEGAYIVLHQLQDPGNAGMILRTADALGIDGVIFCKSCDIYSPKVVRATMGSLFRVPVLVCSDENDVFYQLEEHGIESDAAVVRDETDIAGERKYAENGCAVWIGNEGNGLPETVSSRCSRRITIPMYGNIESLNAAMAAGILMWEMAKGRKGK